MFRIIRRSTLSTHLDRCQCRFLSHHESHFPPLPSNSVLLFSHSFLPSWKFGGDNVMNIKHIHCSLYIYSSLNEYISVRASLVPSSVSWSWKRVLTQFLMQYQNIYIETLENQLEISMSSQPSKGNTASVIGHIRLPLFMRLVSCFRRHPYNARIDLALPRRTHVNITDDMRLSMMIVTEYKKLLKQLPISMESSLEGNIYINTIARPIKFGSVTGSSIIVNSDGGSFDAKKLQADKICIDTGNGNISIGALYSNICFITTTEGSIVIKTLNSKCQIITNDSSNIGNNSVRIDSVDGVLSLNQRGKGDIGIVVGQTSLININAGGTVSLTLLSPGIFDLCCISKNHVNGVRMRLSGTLSLPLLSSLDISHIQEFSEMVTGAKVCGVLSLSGTGSVLIPTNGEESEKSPTISKCSICIFGEIISVSSSSSSSLFGSFLKNRMVSL